MVLLKDGRVASAPRNINPHTFAFFNLAFRPFFFLAALFSVLSIGMWALSFTTNLQFSPYGGVLFWHAHEMLFGFTAAIIAGFLLTAVQTWTKVDSIKGKPLGVLVFLWLLPRVLLAFPLSLPHTLIITTDLLFLPLAALFLSMPIIKARLWRNLFFVPILLLMATLNGLMHLSIQGVSPVSFLTLSHIMILLVTLVMCIMGGRVFPMFTANGTKTERVSPLAYLEKLSILSVIACLVLVSGFLSPPPVFAASIFFLAAAANFIRAFRWRIQLTFKTPLLWSLHLSYWSLCAGLMMLGLAKLNLLANASLAYHALTVGGIGSMILSMISRVSLGHTGRALKVGNLMSLAFGLMLITLLTRVFAPLFVDQYLLLILLSAVLWVSAYSIFLVVYFPVLFKARIDGTAG